MTSGLPATRGPNMHRSRGGLYFDWADGIPTPKYVEPWTKASVSALIVAAAAIPYTPPDKRQEMGAERFEGMTALEVATIRLVEEAADGDIDATREIYDRVLGKPKQETQNVNVQMTYMDYLKAWAEEDAAEIVEVTELQPTEAFQSYSKVDELDGL